MALQYCCCSTAVVDDNVKERVKNKPKTLKKECLKKKNQRELALAVATGCFGALNSLVSSEKSETYDNTAGNTAGNSPPLEYYLDK